MADKGPKQAYRKIIIRLRPDRLDEANLLQDYDFRSQKLESADHDYIRRCLLIGHLFVTNIEAFGGKALALSNNESNNTGKEHSDISTNKSNVSDPAPDAQVKEVVGSAIRNMSKLFSGSQKTS